MTDPYWCDPIYIQTVTGKIAGLHTMVQTSAGFPIAVIENQPGLFHLANPPGFLCPDSREGLETYLKDAQKIAEDHDALTAYFLFRGQESAEDLKPVLQSTTDFFFLTERTAVYVPLSQDLETQLARLNGKMRTKIRALERKKVRYELRYEEEFQRLYDEIAMQRGFSDIYRYDEKDMQNILQAQGIQPVSVFDGEGQYLGGSLIGHYSDQVCDYIISCNTKDVNMSGRSVLWKSLRAASEMGYEWINLGGGNEEDDSLIYFKMSLGGERRSFFAMKIIWDLDKYSEVYGPPSDDGVLAGHFPPPPL